ncbi:ABC-type transport auxiliary lipoprotein family protein [Terrihabitans sp. B22-R8]|uniref:ABC-type transport auxiliary lipoprotein family protein n=1 Tax=Terrihabitans sp. B22-R8 TaxID=3425128 RepID=UPI00403CE248
MPSIIKHASARNVSVLALALVLSGCAGLGKQAPSATFDLSAPPPFTPDRNVRRGVLAVEMPSAIQTLDSNRMVARIGPQITYIPAAQYSDTLPGLLQTRLVQAFENAGRIGSVGRAQDRIAADFQLLTEIRAFEVSVSGSTNTAVIEIATRIVDRDGRVRAGRVFQAQAPVADVSGAGASHGLNAALWQVLVEIVNWTNGQV